MKQYSMSMFASKNDMEDAIMRDMSLNDFEKMMWVFEIHKEEIKRAFPQLYYSLLGVRDMNKTGYKFEKE